MNQVCLHPHFIRQSLNYLKQDNVLYLQNAKSGCSTVRAGLIRARSPRMGLDLPPKLTPQIVHGNWEGWSPDIGLISPKATFAFTIVRNPFTRLLSAYLDKIAKRDLIGEQFRYSVGLPARADLSFAEFVALLDPQSTLLDQHWRPQVANILAGHVCIDQIHYLEGFAETKFQLVEGLGFNVDFQTRDPHGTSARSKLEKYYTDEIRDRVLEIYGRDFDTFGYSRKVEDADTCPSRPMSLAHEGTGAYRLLSILSNATRPPLTELKEKDDLSFEELAIACLVYGRRGAEELVPDRKEIVALAREGTPAQRYLALSVLETVPDAGGAGISLEENFRQRAVLAPYFISTWFGLVETLIEAGKHEAARSELTRLEICTWKKAKTLELSEKL